MLRVFDEQLVERLRKRVPFIQIIIGPRQVGKTTSVQRLPDSFLERDIHYSSADLPTPPDASWIIAEWQVARLKAVKKETILILDEIQKVPRWSEIVKKLFDEDRHNENLWVVILGSSSLQLGDGMQESLLGRYELTRAHHWGFTESRALANWSLDEFLQFGGYPAATLLASDVERWQQFMRDAVIEPLLSRDLLILKNVNKASLLRQTLALSPSLGEAFLKLKPNEAWQFLLDCSQ
jgi:hypothetical protein